MTTAVSSKIEYKTLSFKVETVDEDQGIITGYLSTFNNIDLGNGYIRDRVKPGAFKRTIAHAIERKSTKGKKYLWPHLWMHSPEEPIGGYIDAKEDSKGLLVTYQLDISKNTAGIPNNPTATKVFSGYKHGYIDEQSIGYETIKSELVEEMIDGEKTMVRDLLELRLWEGSSITSNFAMNPEATVTGVKSMNNYGLESEYKSACGSTSGPIGPRDESWDGSAAKSWIWSKALDEEGNVKPAVAKKYFMRCDGDPKLKGSYGYPFWTHDHISVGGVKAVAGALSHARGADAGGDTAGMQRKVERLYNRINSKYPDDPKLVPPWKDGDGKSGGDSWERKTFIEHYNEEKAESLLSDLQGVWFAAFCKAVVDAFKIGDEPEVDISEALDNFKLQFMKDFVPHAMSCDMSDYLATDDMDSPLRTNSGGYGYMSRRSRLSRKELLASDATTGGFYANDRDSDSEGDLLTRGHVDKLHQAATKAMQAISEHVEGVHNIADQVTTLIGGPNWTDRDAEKRALPLAKAGRAFSGANAQALSDHAEALHDLADTHKKTMTKHIKAVRTVADDLADILQGSEAAYGTEEGTPTEGRQEGKSNGTSYHDTRASVSRSSTAQDTVSDEEFAASLQKFKALRNSLTFTDIPM